MAEQTSVEGVEHQLRGLRTRLEEKYGPLRGRIELEARVSLNLHEIGGLEKAKLEIEGLGHAFRDPALQKRWGTKTSRAILLYGPPGTGKSLLASALALRAEAALVLLRMACVLLRWQDQAPVLLRDLLNGLEGAGRVVLFLDELDALHQERLRLVTSDAARGMMFAFLLVFLDDLEYREEYLVVASTNRPDSIHPDFVRPGRFDRLIEMTLPSPEEQRVILEIHKVRAEAIAGRPLFQPLDYPPLLKRIEGMSGADLAEVIRRALEDKMRLEARGDRPDLVSTEDLVREAEVFRRIREVGERIRTGQYL